VDLLPEPRDQERERVDQVGGPDRLRGELLVLHREVVEDLQVAVGRHVGPVAPGAVPALGLALDVQAAVVGLGDGRVLERLPIVLQHRLVVEGGGHGDPAQALGDLLGRGPLGLEGRVLRLLLGGLVLAGEAGAELAAAAFQLGLLGLLVLGRGGPAHAHPHAHRAGHAHHARAHHAGRAAAAATTPAAEGGGLRGLLGLLLEDAVPLGVERVDERAAAAGVGEDVGRGDQLGLLADQAGARLGGDPLAAGLEVARDQDHVRRLLRLLGEVGRLDAVGRQLLDDLLGRHLAPEVGVGLLGRLLDLLGGDVDRRPVQGVEQAVEEQDRGQGHRELVAESEAEVLQFVRGVRHAKSSVV